jgi:hypothetical protein
LLEDFLGEEYYKVSEQRRNQFVGRIEMNEEEFEKLLHKADYERNPMAWLKRRAKTGELHEGSWRKTDGDMQTHLILYDGEQAPNAQTGELFIYAHYEYRWDTHPIKHFNGVDADAQTGVRRVRKMLQEKGINYEYIQPG